MSDSTITQNDTTENGSTSEQDPFDLITDSRLTIEDVEERNGIMTWVGDLAKKAKSAMVTEENTTRALAWAESFLSSFCMTPKGPDWGGKLGVYAALVVNPRMAALEGASPAQIRKLRQNVRQAKGRGGAKAPILLAIVRYVLTTDERFADLAAGLKDYREGLKDLVLENAAKDPSPELIEAVNAQYRNASGAGEPPKGTAFRKAWDGDTTGTGGDTADASRSDAENAARDVSRGVLAVPKVTPATTSEAMRDMLRALVAKTVVKDEPITDRPKIRETLTDTLLHLGLYVKVLAGDASDAEVRKLVVWSDPDAGKADAPKADAPKADAGKADAGTTDDAGKADAK